MIRRWRPLAALAAVALGLALAPAPASALTVWAVGDGAVAGPEDDAVAARIESETVDHFLFLGDVYETGTAHEYATRYHPSYGRFKAKSRPTVGNHEWGNRATGYDPYWGALAPQQPGGGHYYSFDFGGWHFISLSTEEPAGTGSAQLAWLRDDLAANAGECTIAFMHKPRYSASFHQDDPAWEPIWAQLVGARAIALLSGHDHDYQRFKPNRGMVQFIVGSGGRERRPVNPFDPDLAAYNDTTFGALRMNLFPNRLDFAFVPTTGPALDSGSLPCPPATPRPPAGSPPAATQPGRVRITRPRAGATYRRTPRRLEGRAQRVRGPVRLTLVRRARGRCRVLGAHGLRRAACGTRRSRRARGIARWRLRLRAGSLPPGRYRLTARARGHDGVIASDTVRFRIRRSARAQ